jgi:hypothetical protein
MRVPASPLARGDREARRRASGKREWFQRRGWPHGTQSKKTGAASSHCTVDGRLNGRIPECTCSPNPGLNSLPGNRVELHRSLAFGREALPTA